MIKNKKIKFSDKIVIGTAQFLNNYGIIKKSNQRPSNFLKEISGFNVNTFDTSEAYKKSFLLIEKKKNNSNLIIKFSVHEKKRVISIKKFIKKVNYALKKIRKNKIYAFMIHDYNLNSCDQVTEHIKFLSNYSFKKDINFGFSIYNLDEFENIKKRYKFNILQIPLNVFNRDFLNKNFQKYVIKNKIEIHARSIFLQGLLINNHNLFPRKLKKFLKYFITWKKFCIKNNVSLKEACIIFATKQKFVSKFVLGFKNSKELEQILKINLKKKINFNKNFLNIPNKLKNPNLW